MSDLLYEIGTEELPAGYLEPALEQLAAEVERRLSGCRLPPERVRTAGTPRRLALAVEGIPEVQPPVEVRSVGPPATVAFDQDGNPTPAAEGFARSKGVPVESLQVEQTQKGPYVVAVRQEAGRPAADLLPELLRQATAAVGWPKSMRWEPEGCLFARPIRRLAALLDAEVLPLTIAGIAAGRTTRGHRFLAPEELDLEDASFDSYLEALRSRFVIADIQERRELIRRQVNELLAPHGSELADEALLEQVANMVEHPHAVEGSFDEHFLEVPAPVLVAAMKEHQAYFPVYDAEGKLPSSSWAGSATTWSAPTAWRSCRPASRRRSARGWTCAACGAPRGCARPIC
ncbi:MAG: hypothetical protein AMK73_08525 [Planctomycetes bacterium SM23_32]|nr:MAG: hypothetical protein AMK73_08525 [Planctomycetes bacterium SM23_32]